MKFTWVYILSSLLSVHSAFAVIFGEDNRMIISKEQHISAIAGLAKFENVKFNPELENTMFRSRYLVNAKPVNDKVKKEFGHNLCEGNLLEKSKTTFSCTAFLIAPDKVMTAGHCIFNKEFSLVRNKNIEDENIKIIFGHDVKELTRDNTYSVTTIIEAQHTRLMGDYAILKLNREVEGVEPLVINLDRQTYNNVKGPIYSIGYPMGVTHQVLSREAQFQEPFELKGQAFFRGNIDAIRGTSGSPVLNSKHEVIGIYVQKTFKADFFTMDSFIFNKKDQCIEDLVIPDDFNGSMIQRISTIYNNGIDQDFQNQIYWGDISKSEKRTGILSAEELYQTGKVNINALFYNYGGHYYRTLSLAIERYERTRDTSAIEFLLSLGVEIDYVSYGFAKSLASNGDSTVLDLFKSKKVRATF